jgi:hypothetical protein
MHILLNQANLIVYLWTITTLPNNPRKNHSIYSAAGRGSTRLHTTCTSAASLDIHPAGSHLDAKAQTITGETNWRNNE